MTQSLEGVSLAPPECPPINRPPLTSNSHSSRALGTQTLPTIRTTSFPHLQLLSKRTETTIPEISRPVHHRARASTTTLWNVGLRLCRDARTCPLTCRRTRQTRIGASHPVTQTIGRTQARPASRGPVLASALLRFQSVERTKVRGKAALHPPEPADARTRDPTRGLALEQLPTLCDWKIDSDRNRIALDSASAGAPRNFSDSAPAKRRIRT